MSFQKFESESYCVGGRHRSATKKTYGYLTGKGHKILVGYCSSCNRNKSMTVSDTALQAENLGRFLKEFG